MPILKESKHNESAGLRPGLSDVDLNSALGISPSSKETFRVGDTNIEKRSPLKDGLSQSLFTAVESKIKGGITEGSFFCKPQIPFDLREPRDFALLKNIAIEVRGRILDEYSGRFELKVKARRCEGSVRLEVAIKETRKVRQPRSTVNPPSTARVLSGQSNIFSRVEQIVDCTRNQVLLSGRSRFALSVDPTKFRSEDELKRFIDAIDSSGFKPGGLSLKVSSQSKKEAVNLWHRAQSQGGKVVLNLQSYFAPVDSIEGLNSMACEMAQVIECIKQKKSSSQVLVRIPDGQLVHAKKLAEILYHLQVKHPGMLKLKIASGSESSYFVRARNVWVLSGNQVEEFIPYGSAEVNVRAGFEDKPPLSTASEPVNSLIDKMKLALYSTPEEGKKALWLTSQTLSETAVNFLTRFRRKHDLAVIAAPEIKAEQRYQKLFAPRSFLQLCKFKVANAFLSAENWWKG